MTSLAQRDTPSSGTCVCCKGKHLQEFLSFPSVPVSGRFREASTQNVTLTDLNFFLCLQCGMLSLQTSHPPPDYVQVNRATRQQLPLYVDKIITGLDEYGIRHDDLIVEIGSNDGTFLRRLRQAGFSNLVGIEPSAMLAASAKQDGFTIENHYFDLSFSNQLKARYGRPNAIVCRHTLEHVSRPDHFASAIRACMDEQSGIVFIEVPDSATIPERTNIHELWDEHLSYFCIENLASLLGHAQFEIDTYLTLPHLDSRNLLVWCRPGSIGTNNVKLAEKSQTHVERWLHFRARFDDYRKALRDIIAKTPRPIYFAGASHPQTNFINLCGIGEAVDFLIDDDPGKQCLFAPISHHAPVVSMNTFFATAQLGTVVLSGFGYPNWMQRLRMHAEKEKLTIIDPQHIVTQTPS